MKSMNMKRLLTFSLAAVLTFSLTACAQKEVPDSNGGASSENLSTGDFCPGKALGPEGAPATPAAGFDPNEDMSFTTTDVAGKEVTNEIFAGSDRGVWVLFWRTDSEKSSAELSKLNGLTEEAAQYGYKILGVVMDGEENADKAAEMASELSFDNIIWNESMALRFAGIEDFFSEEFFESNKDQFDELRGVKDPVSTCTNSRGQMQGPCTLFSLSEEKLVNSWKDLDCNATYDELMAEGQEILKGN